MNIRERLQGLVRKIMSWRRTPAITLVLAGALLVAAVMVAGPSGVSADEVLRDCDDNAIMRCGSADAAEFVTKAIANDPGDLDNVYAHFGLPPSKYDEFASAAKQGTIHRDGRIEVDGQVVATDAATMGRQDFGNDTPVLIGDKTYYSGTPDKRWTDGVPSLPVMVWFDGEGTVKVAILSPCGNPVPHMKKVKSGAECKDLIKEPVEDKKDTYRFTTDASKFGLAEFLKFEYFVDEGEGEKLFATTEKADEPVEREFTKNAVVRVKITISVPGGHERVIVSDECVAQITVEKEKPPVPVTPVLSVKTVKPAALPVTGPAGLASLFVGVSAAGAIGHHWYNRRRR